MWKRYSYDVSRKETLFITISMVCITCYSILLDYAVSICTVVVYYTLKYYMHGSLFFSKKLSCTVFWNAICTAVCFSLKNLPFTLFWKAICMAVCFSLTKTTVHCILECYMHSSLFFAKKSAVHSILEGYMHGSLFFSNKNCRVLYFGMLHARQSVFL